jgi:hypothetical protein
MWVNSEQLTQTRLLNVTAQLECGARHLRQLSGCELHWRLTAMPLRELAAWELALAGLFR